MKKLILSAFVLFAFNVAYASKVEDIQPAPQASTCQYTVDDAIAGIKRFVNLGAVVVSKTKDGHRTLNNILFHDPASGDPESLDAVALVMLDDRLPGKEIVFMVTYDNKLQTVLWKREIKEVEEKQPDGSVVKSKTIGGCFSKEVEKKAK